MRFNYWANFPRPYFWAPYILRARHSFEILVKMTSLGIIHFKKNSENMWDTVNFTGMVCSRQSKLLYALPSLRSAAPCLHPVRTIYTRWHANFYVHACRAEKSKYTFLNSMHNITRSIDSKIFGALQLPLFSPPVIIAPINSRANNSKLLHPE